MRPLHNSLGNDFSLLLVLLAWVSVGGGEHSGPQATRRPVDIAHVDIEPVRWSLHEADQLLLGRLEPSGV